MASKKQGAGKSKKPESPSESSEEEQAPSKYAAKGKGKMQKTKSSEKVAEPKSKSMAGKEKGPTVSKGNKKQHMSDGETDVEYAKPKKNLSAYVIFSNHKREEVYKKYPDILPKNVMKELGRMWNSCTDAEKAPYDEMALKDKERFEKEMEEFEENGKYHDEDGNVVTVKPKRMRSTPKKEMNKKKPAMKKKY